MLLDVEFKYVNRDVMEECKGIEKSIPGYKTYRSVTKQVLQVRKKFPLLGSCGQITRWTEWEDVKTEE